MASTKQQLLPLLLAAALLLTIVFAAFSFHSPSQNSTDYSDAIEYARTEIWRTINVGTASSGSIAIMDQGRIVYSEGFAMADRANDIPIDSNNKYNIGSISKTFCAAAVMVLVDDGKVKLDEPAATYLPNFTMADPRYQNITVRMLLDHTSGLPGTVYSNNIGYGLNPNVYQDILSALSKSYLKANPGEYAPYSNDGYNLAEMLVAQVSGQSYIDFLSQRIFTPLGLDHTGLCVGEQDNRTIAGLYRPTNGARMPSEILSILGAGGLSSTPNDLLRFADSFSTGGRHILSQSSIAEMIKPHLSVFAQHSIAQTGINPEFYYGLGLDIAGLPLYQDNGVYVIGKGGDTSYYHSWLLSAPNYRLSVAFVEVGTGNNAPDIVVQIFNKLLQAKGLMPKEATPEVTALHYDAIPPEYLKYAGYYAPNKQLSFDITTGTCTLTTLLSNGGSSPMAMVYKDGYFTPDGIYKFYFKTIDNQNYLILRCEGDILYTVWGQQLPKIETPQILSIDVNGVQWLRRNVASYEITTFMPPFALPHIVTSTTIPGLSGYVNFNGIAVVTSATYAAVPVGAVRDQNDLTLINKDGTVWAQSYDCLYSLANQTTPLRIGANTVTIGNDGYNQWFVASSSAVLSFQAPAHGRVIVFTNDGRTIYDNAVADGDLFVTAGCYVEVAGQVGDTFTINAK